MCFIGPAQLSVAMFLKLLSTEFDSKICITNKSVLGTEYVFKTQE